MEQDVFRVGESDMLQVVEDHYVTQKSEPLG